MQTLDEIVSFHEKRVLDIGCGDGRTTRHIAHSADSVLGIDPDEKAIAEARVASSANHIRYQQGNVLEFNPPPSSFDIVLFSRSIC